MNPKILALLFIPLLLIGCWDAEEVTDRVVVLAFGMDKAANDMVKVSVQVPIVEELLPITGGAQVAQKPFSLLTAEGKSVFAAVPGLQGQTQRSLFYGQIKAVIIEKELAKEGLKGSIDALNRHATIPPQAFVLLTKGKAYDILNYSLWHKRIPSYVLVKFFQSRGKGDRAFSQQIWELSRNINSQTQDAFLPLIDYEQGEEALIISGLGVFHNDKLVGELSGDETRMFGLLTGRSRNTYLSLPVPNYGRITFRKIKSSPQIRVNKTGTETIITVNLKVFGYLVESTQGEVGLKRDDVHLIEREFERYLHQEMTKTIQKLQRINSDILGLGEEFRIKYPLEWEKIEWDKVYPDAQIELSVKFTVQRFGVMR